MVLPAVVADLVIELTLIVGLLTRIEDPIVLAVPLGEEPYHLRWLV